MNVLILGGSGGIGGAILQALCTDAKVSSIHATYHATTPTFSHHKLSWYELDPSSDSQVQSLLNQVGQLNWCINAVGVLHDAQHGPEKTVQRFDTEFFNINMQVNVTPTLLLAKYINANFKGVAGAVFATVSAKVGSISDNQLGGWVSYRASKAALNMSLKTIAIEWQRKLPNVCVASLHPGTTDTELSKPFQSNVPSEKLFSPAKTASLLIDVIETLTPALSGRFWSWDGSELPW